MTFDAIYDVTIESYLEHVDNRPKPKHSPKQT